MDTPDKAPHEPAHLFKVTEHDTAVTYISADRVIVGDNGVVQLLVEDTSAPYYTSNIVGVILPCPGVTVVRVDALINKEGLTTT